MQYSTARKKCLLHIPMPSSMLFCVSTEAISTQINMLHAVYKDRYFTMFFSQMQKENAFEGYRVCHIRQKYSDFFLNKDKY